MRDDELRSLLAGWIEPDTDLPPVERVQAEAGRRRTTRWGIAAGVMTVVVGATVMLPTLIQPGLTARPAATASASPAPPTTSPSPAETDPAVCRTIGAAWAQALTATPTFPATVGVMPRVEHVGTAGHDLVVSGTVSGRRVLTWFPEGFDGPSIAIPVRAGQVNATVVAVSAGVLVYTERRVVDSSVVQRWLVVETTAPTPRVVVTERPYQEWVEPPALLVGRTVQWVEDRRWAHRGNGPAPEIVVMSASLDEPATGPTKRRVFPTPDLETGFVPTQDTLYVRETDGTWQGYDRVTLQPSPASPALAEIHRFWAKDSSGSKILYASGTGVELRLMDAITGVSEPITRGDLANATIADNLVLYATADAVRLRDVHSGTDLKLLDLEHDPTRVGPYYALDNGLLIRKALNDDPGGFTPLTSLPTSLPPC